MEPPICRFNLGNDAQFLFVYTENEHTWCPTRSAKCLHGTIATKDGAMDEDVAMDGGFKLSMTISSL